MTDYLNPDKLYPDDISRRIDTPPGFDSVRTGTGPWEHRMILRDNPKAFMRRPAVTDTRKIIATNIRAITGQEDITPAMLESGPDWTGAPSTTWSRAGGMCRSPHWRPSQECSSAPSKTFSRSDDMTAEDFLNSIRHLDNEINALDLERCRWMDKRQDLLDSAESHGSMSGVVVQHAVSSRTESIGIQLADMITPDKVVDRINRYQERINRKIDKLVDRKQEALDVIERIPSTTHRALLLYRYLNCLKWETIADLMGYEPNYTRFELKQAAIAAYEAAAKDLS